MDTLANTHRPKFFHEYVAAGESVKGSLRLIQNIISRNLFGNIKNLLITGSPGCGKTTLARLVARATLCHNRPEGEYEPCGECSVCIGEDTTNIFHYTITSPKEAREPIQRLVERAYQHPIRTIDRSDQFRQFIILDEVQLSTPELLGELLAVLEHGPKTTTWILNSMDPDKLARRDPAMAEALNTRCVGVPLPDFTEDQITDNIVSKMGDLDYEAAAVIAQFSKGSMREAWSILDKFLPMVEDTVEEITVELLMDNLAGGATPELRQELWESLSKGEGDKVKKLVLGWLKQGANPKTIAHLLEQDLYDFLSTQNPGAQQILASLSRWYSSPHPYPLLTVLMQHLGTNVIPFPAERSQIILIPTQVDRVVPDVRVTLQESLGQQLIKLKAVKTGIPKFFLCENTSDIYSAYLTLSREVSRSTCTQVSDGMKGV